MPQGLKHVCGNCGRTWHTTGYSIECPRCKHMRGVPRAENFKEGKQRSRYEEICRFRPDELAELMILFENGQFKGL